MSNIAFILLQIPDLSGGGGAERFFADFFETYNKQTNPEHTLFFITDDTTNLRKAGFLNSHQDKILIVKNYRFFTFSRIKTVQNFFSKFIGNYLLQRQIIQKIKQKKIRILHIPLYEKRDFELYKAVDSMALTDRPKIVLNIVDCRIPYLYHSKTTKFYNSTKGFYEDFFNKIKIDGVYSWYEKFKEFALKEKLLPSDPLIKAIASRYSTLHDHVKSLKEKQKLIVWASRLDEQKDPMFFIEAIKLLHENPGKEILKEWKFEMYGKGPLEPIVKSAIKERNLENILTLNNSSAMSEVYNHSMCYVSTQEYENFPSLSMAEAMNMGNAVIAKNVGQTNLFVKENKNGFLCDEKSPASLSEKIRKYITLDGSDQKRFGEESIRLMNEVHTKENFIHQTDIFWNEVLK